LTEEELAGWAKKNRYLFSLIYLLEMDIENAIPLTSENGQYEWKENAGRWTNAEHALFLEGLRTFGKAWKKIALLIKTRTVIQVRTHAQKYFLKVAKSNQNGIIMDDVNLNSDNLVFIPRKVRSLSHISTASKSNDFLESSSNWSSSLPSNTTAYSSYVDYASCDFPAAQAYSNTQALLTISNPDRFSMKPFVNEDTSCISPTSISDNRVLEPQGSCPEYISKQANSLTYHSNMVVYQNESSHCADSIVKSTAHAVQIQQIPVLGTGLPLFETNLSGAQAGIEQQDCFDFGLSDTSSSHSRKHLKRSRSNDIFNVDGSLADCFQINEFNESTCFDNSDLAFQYDVSPFPGVFNDHLDELFAGEFFNF